MKSMYGHAELLDEISFLVSDSIVVCDHNKVIIKANKAFTSISGFKESEIIGKKLNTLFSTINDTLNYENIWYEVEHKGTWQGETKYNHKCGEIYSQQQTLSAIYNDNDVIIYYVSISVDFSDNTTYENAIYKLEHYDQVTNLPNKLLLKQLINNEITKSSSTNKGFAVLFLNLDGLKHINCNMGHKTGDDLINIVAKRIYECTPEDSIIARWASDEIVIIQPDINTSNEAINIIDIIYPCLFEPISFPDQRQFVINASIGISQYPSHGNNADTLIHNAAMAMHSANTCNCAINGTSCHPSGNCYHFYTAEMNFSVIEYMSIETGLRSALAFEQFELYYQPIIDIKTNAIISAEALIRWNHPKKGLIPPDRFIPVAEDSDLIIKIGEWVLNKACLQNKQWHDAGHENLKINVNLSAKQFSDNNLAKTVRIALEKSDLDPRLLTLELTESAIMDNVSLAINSIYSLKEIGVSLAIDDFGTGYSSLAYLKRFPIDKLKIDKSFIEAVDTDTDDRSIVQSIIALGHSLNLSIVAEGVEKIEHLNLLDSNGCEEAQGYFISKPLRAEEFEKFMQQWKFKKHDGSHNRRQDLKVV